MGNSSLENAPIHGTLVLEVSLVNGIVFAKIGLANGKLLNCGQHTLIQNLAELSRGPPCDMQGVSEKAIRPTLSETLVALIFPFDVLVPLA